MADLSDTNYWDKSTPSSMIKCAKFQSVIHACIRKWSCVTEKFKPMWSYIEIYQYTCIPQIHQKWHKNLDGERNGHLTNLISLTFSSTFFLRVDMVLREGQVSPPTPISRLSPLQVTTGLFWRNWFSTVQMTDRESFIYHPTTNRLSPRHKVSQSRGLSGWLSGLL